MSQTCPETLQPWRRRLYWDLALNSTGYSCLRDYRKTLTLKTPCKQSLRVSPPRWWSTHASLTSYWSPNSVSQSYNPHHEPRITHTRPHPNLSHSWCGFYSTAYFLYAQMDRLFWGSQYSSDAAHLASFYSHYREVAYQFSGNPRKWH